MSFRLFPCLLIVAACGAEVNDAPTDNADAVTDLTVAAPDTEDNPFASPDVEECDAEVFRGAIGQDLATTAFAPSPDLRIFSEADLVTQEYLPKRTNIVTDLNGVITRVYCG